MAKTWMIKLRTSEGEAIAEFDTIGDADKVFDQAMLDGDKGIELLECDTLRSFLPLTLMKPEVQANHKVAYRDSSKLDGPDLIIEREGDDDIT